MRVYQCDSCKKTITDPHTVKMKEFYVGADFDNGICFPVDVREKIKIHLCDECYKGLHLIADVIEKVNCEKCKHYSKNNSQYPCSHCSNCYTSKFELMEDCGQALD